MNDTAPSGPFCQSCGMPLEKAEDFGTQADGLRVNDYCHYCFSDGEFTDPEISEAAMIARCAGIVVRKTGMPEVQARRLMAGVIPRLKRWRGAGVV